jgi:hypothetical protein
VRDEYLFWREETAGAGSISVGHGVWGASWDLANSTRELCDGVPCGNSMCPLFSFLHLAFAPGWECLLSKGSLFSCSTSKLMLPNDNSL